MNAPSMEEIGLSPRKDGLSYQIFPDPSDFDRCCKLKDRLPSIVVEPTEGEVESGELRWPPEEFLVQEDEQDNCEETCAGSGPGVLEAAAGPAAWQARAGRAPGPPLRPSGQEPGAPAPEVTMAVIGSLAVPNRSSGHLPTLLPMSRGCTQVPVDQKPGSRVWSLQLSCQGTVFPCRVLRAHEGADKNSQEASCDGIPLLGDRTFGTGTGGLSGKFSRKVTPSEVSFRPQGLHSPGLHQRLKR